MLIPETWYSCKQLENYKEMKSQFVRVEGTEELYNFDDAYLWIRQACGPVVS